MATLNRLIERHRTRLKQRAKLSRMVLVGAIPMAILCFGLFILALGDTEFLFLSDFLHDNPDEMLGVSNFFVGTAVGAALRMWRSRQLRIKLMIAEAMMRESEDDTAIRLLLEPMFGEEVWEQFKDEPGPAPIAAAA